MKIALDTEGTLSGFKKTIDKIIQEDDAKGILLLSCADNNFTPDDLDPLLKELTLPVFGGCFPGILYQKEVFERGTLAVALPVKPRIQIIEELSIERDNFDAVIDTSSSVQPNNSTIFMIVDGMSLQVSSLLESVFNKIGLIAGYIGGGAASLELKKKPTVITNEGLKQDCAVIAQVDLESGIGVSHGMNAVSGPYKVTGASFNTISTIDWEPAGKVYKDLITQHEAYNEEKLSFIKTDAHYSLGLNRYDAENVILEPISVEHDNSLGFMMDVREGEFVNIMHVTENSMIQSAKSALNRAFDSLRAEGSPQTIISFDCVSRKLFLGERFVEELDAICSAGVMHVGALTCGGEIGTNGKDFLDYHNRTCVLGLFEK